MTEWDAEAVHALLQAEQVPPEARDFAAWWERLTADAEYDPGLCLVVGEHTIDGALIAWDSAFIKDIVVAPHARRRGVGKALIDELATRLIDRGKTSVDLKVEETNLGAQRFYAQLGFQKA